MRTLFISKSGKSLPLAERVQREGHASGFYIVDEKARRVGQGIVDKPKFTLPIMNKGGYAVQSNVNQLLTKTSPDFVIFDTVGLGRLADSIRKSGVPVLGACRWADEAELDSFYSRRLMKQVDISIVEGEVEGVEVGCELWWNGLSSYMHNITFKDERFMNEGIGPSIGCAGNVVKMVSPKARVVKEGVGKMERLLKKTTYRGPIHLDMIATKDDLFGVKLGVSFEYDALQALFELYKGSITELLYTLASGSNGCGEFTKDYAISVRLSIPPYPHLKEGAEEGIPVVVDNCKHVWWGDVMKSGDSYVSAGVSGIIAAVTARGRDVTECRRRVYRTVNNISVEDAQWRTDIGLRVNRDEKKLKSWGYL